MNGSIRSSAGSNITEYVGVDFAEGPGVDVVLDDPYKLPFEDNTFDALLTSSCLEHSEMFWLTFLEGMRVLKPEGLFYYNVPTAWMAYHRFPVDCWRFYPDSAKALETWGKRNGLNTMVLETYVSTPVHRIDCADVIAIFVKDANYADKHSRRMMDVHGDFWNGFRFPVTEKYPDGWTKPANEFHLGTHP